MPTVYSLHLTTAPPPRESPRCPPPPAPGGTSAAVAARWDPAAGSAHAAPDPPVGSHKPPPTTPRAATRFVVPCGAGNLEIWEGNKKWAKRICVEVLFQVLMFDSLDYFLKSAFYPGTTGVGV